MHRIANEFGRVRAVRRCRWCRRTGRPSCRVWLRWTSRATLVAFGKRRFSFARTRAPTHSRTRTHQSTHDNTPEQTNASGNRRVIPTCAFAASSAANPFACLCATPSCCSLAAASRCQRCCVRPCFVVQPEWVHLRRDLRRKPARRSTHVGRKCAGSPNEHTQKQTRQTIDRRMIVHEL